MLCPICEDLCSCWGQTKLSIQKDARKKRPDHSKSLKNSKKPKSSQADLDAQLAISEYYFTEQLTTESSEDDGQVFELDITFDTADSQLIDTLADYYGYSSGSDLEDLLEKDDISSESDSSENFVPPLSSHSYIETEILLDHCSEDLVHLNKNFVDKNETLAQQIAKITPQILAAISVTAKNLHGPGANTTLPPSQYLPSSSKYFNSGFPPRNASTVSFAQIPGPVSDHHSTTHPIEITKHNIRSTVSLEEVMDTNKMSMLFSTSPTTNIHSPIAPVAYNNTRHVPLGAYRKSRRCSMQAAPGSTVNLITSALKKSSIGQCTLSDFIVTKKASSSSSIEITPNRRKEVKEKPKKIFTDLYSEFEPDTSDFSMALTSSHSLTALNRA